MFNKNEEPLYTRHNTPDWSLQTELINESTHLKLFQQLNATKGGFTGGLLHKTASARCGKRANHVYRV